MYSGMITCSCVYNKYADYCINPNDSLKGNSFAVPAVARLLAYNFNLYNDNEGEDVFSLFKNTDRNKNISNSGLLRCYQCKKILKINNSYIYEYPQNCPYCGVSFDRYKNN